jgi:hypothetical protein
MEGFLAGGTDNSSGTALGDFFDPATSPFSATATGGTPAILLTATVLQDGRVFLAGGQVTKLVSGPRISIWAVFFRAWKTVYQYESEFRRGWRRVQLSRILQRDATRQWRSADCGRCQR